MLDFNFTVSDDGTLAITQQFSQLPAFKSDEEENDSISKMQSDDQLSDCQMWDSCNN